jgi:hypothetical protein
VSTPAALLQVGGNTFPRQLSGQVTQPLPTLLIIRIQDEEASLAVLVKKICAESDLTPEVGKQVAYVQLLVDADVAPVVKLVGVEIPLLNKSLGQH